MIGSLLLMRLLANQLFEIKPGDPVTLIGAALLMMIVALAASWISGPGDESRSHDRASL